MILDIENCLIEKVREILAPFGFAVEAFPDNPDAYVMTHPKGAVLVVNKGSTYKPPETLGKATQERELSYELLVMVRNLRSHEGVYEAIDALARGLAGWKVPDYSMHGTRIVRDSFVDRDASVWSWGMQVSIRAYLMPKPPESTVGPIKKITVATGSEIVEVRGSGGE